VDAVQTFGRWIKQRRKALDQTQGELAKLVGCSTETIRKVESGKLKPSRDIAERLADALGIAAEQRATFLRAARAPLNTPIYDDPTDQRSSPVHLPTPPTSLVGREEEAQRIGAALLTSDTRLVTLTGPAGIGKTRLSLLVATQVRDQFEDGVFFVPLAPIQQGELVASTIAQVLGVSPMPGRALVDAIGDYLANRHLLLVLDNFEQVLDASPVVARLIAAATTCKLLVTSRASLHVYGEQEWEVPALALPDPRNLPPLDELARNEAVALFVQRARAAKSSWRLDAANAADVAAICVRLDGLPLAIELAAARVKLFTPRTLLARLDSRLAVLTGGAQDLPQRQQTLRDAIAWSYDLLHADEQHLFACLSVFGGGCDIEAAEAVCADACEGDVVDTLEALADKSLLEMQTGAGGEPRWAMLQTTQEYAREQLQERGTAAIRTRRHAEHFLALAERAEPYLTGPRKEEWLAHLDDEHDNLRAALDAPAASVDPATALRLAGALWRFWLIRGHVDEGRRRLAHAVAHAPNAPAAVRARALSGLGTLAFMEGDYAASAPLHEQSLALYEEVGDDGGAAFALNNVATQAHYRGEYDRASELAQNALRRYRALDDVWGIAFTLNNLASVAISQGANEYAADLLAESLALTRQVGDDFETAIRLHNLGDVMLRLGSYERATDYLAESIAMFRKLGNDWGTAHTLHRLALAARRAGEPGRAEELYRQEIALFDGIGDRLGMALGLEGLASVLAEDGDHAHVSHAARFFGAASKLRETIGAPVTPAELPAYEASLAASRAHLGNVQWATAWYEGRTLSLRELLLAYQAALSSPTERR
jgi:predicted ATPase/transcriptional regulator with XRE-family HTH domain